MTSSFEIRYAAPIKLLLTAVGMGPAQSGVTVTPEELCVQMSWAFRANIPIRDIHHAQHSVPPLILGWECMAGLAGGWSTGRDRASSRSRSIRLPGPGLWASPCGWPRCLSA